MMVLKMKKHLYEILINNPSNKYDYAFESCFGRTKNILLQIRRNRSMISFSMGVLYSIKDIGEKDIVKDVLKKAVFSHLLLYGTELKLKRITCSIDHGEYIDIETSSLFSVIGDQKLERIGELKSADSIISHLLLRSFSSDNAVMSCVSSLLIAESKQYQMERFLYFWMAFNSFYKQKNKNDIDQKKYNDLGGLNNILVQYYHSSGFDPKGPRKTREDIAKSAYKAINAWNMKPLTEERLNSECEEQVAAVLKGSEIEGISPYGYLLTFFSYYLRNSYFHGEKIPKILCYSDDFGLKLLELSNAVIEHFLFQHIIDIVPQTNQKNYME